MDRIVKLEGFVKAVLIICVLSLVFVVFSWTGIFNITRPRMQDKNIVIKEIPRRLYYDDVVNSKIKLMMEDGREDEIYSFYDGYTKNREVTYLLISNSLSYGIPIHTLFALARYESGYTVSAINDGKKNSDGSKDFGLLQLNSKTFKEYPVEYLMKPEHNVRMACEYLFRNYLRYKDWNAAVLSYNAGNLETVKWVSLNHLLNIMKYAKDMDIKFSEAFE